MVEARKYDIFCHNSAHFALSKPTFNYGETQYMFALSGSFLPSVVNVQLVLRPTWSSP